jgi:hypothetical protein
LSGLVKMICFPLYESNYARQKRLLRIPGRPTHGIRRSSFLQVEGSWPPLLRKSIFFFTLVSQVA